MGERKLEKCANGKQISFYIYLYTFSEQIFQDSTFLTGSFCVCFAFWCVAVVVVVVVVAFVVVLYLVSVEQARFVFDITTVECQL